MNKTNLKVSTNDHQILSCCDSY